MLLNDKFIFVHVPKTGGTSMRRILTRQGEEGPAHHAPLHAVVKEDRFAFGFIRNPWERMVSWYRFMCQKTYRAGDEGIYKRQAVIDMGFKRWAMEGKFGRPIDKAIGAEGSESIHRRPQMWWLNGCDFIGRFERLQSDFRLAAKSAGFNASWSLPHLQKSSGKDWLFEYDDELSEFIANVYAEDIDYGGYSFDGEA